MNFVDGVIDDDDEKIASSKNYNNSFCTVYYRQVPG